MDLRKLRRAVLHIVMILLVIGIQDLLLSHVTILGVRPMFVPAALVAVGMLEGGVYGGLIGLLAGLLCDRSFHENTVLFTVLMPAIGFFAGAASGFLVNKRFFSYLFVAAAALALTAVAQLLPLLLFQGTEAGPLFRTALLQCLWSLPLAALTYPPYKALSLYGTSGAKGL